MRKPIVSAREIITKETIVTEKSYKNPIIKETKTTKTEEGILPKLMILVIGLCYLVFC